MITYYVSNPKYGLLKPNLVQVFIYTVLCSLSPNDLNLGVNGHLIL